MTDNVFLALAGFALATSITPGPNNLMLMASGANFGLRRTLPHMLGVSLGHMFLMIMVGLGLVRLFELWPVLHTGLKVAGTAYLLLLAWKIARAAAPSGGDAEGRPLTFLEAAAFQWVNPKGWFMAVTALSVYAPAQSFAGVVVVAAVFAAINLPSVWIWAALGQAVRRWLTSPDRLRAFNWTMAGLLVASLVVIL
jgi:threonine/homoserine/homoserine lactone efflux protein